MLTKIRPFISKLLLLACTLTGSLSYAGNVMEDSFGELNDEVDEWQVRIELARVLSYQKKYAESIKEYRRILEEQPTNLTAKLELAQVLAYDGQKEEALQLVQQLPIGQFGDKNQLAVADIFASAEQYEPAEKIYLKYLRKRPKDLRARFKYAQLLSWAKKYSDSLSEYETLLKARPDDIHLRRKYALVLIWSGEPELAREQLEKTLTAPGHEARK